MRGRIINCALTMAILCATAMPAMARSYVVCLDGKVDVRFSSETVTTTLPFTNGMEATAPLAAAGPPLFFTAAAPIYGVHTDTSLATDCTPATLGASPLGTFFGFGSLVRGLPQSIPPNLADDYYVNWHFRINGKGAFDTSGLLRTAPPLGATTSDLMRRLVTYQQTITGSTDTDLSPVSGTAFVTNLPTGGPGILAFKITTPTNN